MNVTSVKGIIARPTISVYGITKFGAENFSDCLRLEMRKFGVKVSIVEPGNFGGLTGIVKDQNVINLCTNIVESLIFVGNNIFGLHGKPLPRIDVFSNIQTLFMLLNSYLFIEKR